MQSASMLEVHGIIHPGHVYWNPSVSALYSESIRRGEGSLAEGGPLVCSTGIHTGRSPNDKFIVPEPSTEEHVWWGKVNRAIDRERFGLLQKSTLQSLTKKDLFVQDCFVGADPTYRLCVRVITERAWHSLFARTMFLPVPAGHRSDEHSPQFTVIDVPSMEADPHIHGTTSNVFIVVDFSQRLVLIGGTSYAGEIKKSLFSVMNYLLPLRNVFPMHCSANMGERGDVALFFGLSGTGKTTLSSVANRSLIGDDEHGWSDEGVFNFEGGCYAKMIRLSPEQEPQIHSTTRRFGTVLENVAVDALTGELDLDDDRVTENTRGAYPISFIDNSVPSGRGGHPDTIVMLTADAFGVMPPVAKLSPEAAMYHFLSGYTAKVAGTEKGVREPTATCSACFGAPFMIHHPSVYARQLGERISKHKAHVWLVNTGWTGGAYGQGRRISLGDTRAIVDSILSGALNGVRCERDKIFNFEIPTECPNVRDDILQPRDTWVSGADYDAKSRTLAGMFVDNFRAFESETEAGIREAGPR